MLEQKLYKAQEELMELHRKKGEVGFCCAALCEFVLYNIMLTTLELQSEVSSYQCPVSWCVIVDEKKMNPGLWLELCSV